MPVAKSRAGLFFLIVALIGISPLLVFVAGVSLSGFYEYFGARPPSAIETMIWSPILLLASVPIAVGLGLIGVVVIAFSTARAKRGTPDAPSRDAG